MPLKLSNFAGEYVDDAPRSRTAKPPGGSEALGYYVSGSRSIDLLAAQYGAYLEKLTPEQKCFMGAVFFDQLAAGHEYYTMRDSLNCIDPDNLLGEDLSDLIVRIASEDSNSHIAALQAAIAAYVIDDVAEA